MKRTAALREADLLSLLPKISLDTAKREIETRLAEISGHKPNQRPEQHP